MVHILCIENYFYDNDTEIWIKGLSNFKKNTLREHDFPRDYSDKNRRDNGALKFINSLHFLSLPGGIEYVFDHLRLFRPKWRSSDQKALEILN